MWKAFLESLDCMGGHIAVLVTLMLLGVAMQRMGVPKADDITFGSFTALLAVLRLSSKKE